MERYVFMKEGTSRFRKFPLESLDGIYARKAHPVHYEIPFWILKLSRGLSLNFTILNM